ncbi:polyprenyl synthetase family protein [Streptomyces adustus]
MHPTQAKDRPAATPPPVPRLEYPAPAARRQRPGETITHAPQQVADGTAFTASPAFPPVHIADADVPAAVGRVLENVLADRVARASRVDPLFARDLAERVRRFTQDGGKRVRAQLLWWSHRACGGDQSSAAAALRIGAALELLQTCALVHDDVMDAATLRRGRPALHTDVRAQYTGVASASRAERFGEAAAILAGDLALAWADDLVAETDLGPWTATVVRRMWSDMRTEMVAGQYLDEQGQVTAAYSLPRAMRTACLKSALYSVERPLALGAALAGADATVMRALCSAGRNVGIAFQLRDDLDDVFGDSRRTGKACGGDIREGKPTYLVALALTRARADCNRRALAVLERALGNESLTSSGLDDVREILVATGARAAVETKIGQLAAQGLHHFNAIRLDPEARVPLRQLLAAAAGWPEPEIADGGAATRPRPGCTPAPVSACAQEALR